jgi:hypothetical protein
MDNIGCDLKTYSRRRPLSGADNIDSPLPKRSAAAESTDCLFHFVDVKQEVSEEWICGISEGERCDFCSAEFSTSEGLKQHLQGCAQAAFTSASVHRDVLKTEKKTEAETECYVPLHIKSHQPRGQRCKEKEEKRPDGQPTFKEITFYDYKLAKGLALKKCTDARMLYPTKIWKGRRKTTFVIDNPNFIVGLDQLEELYSEATRNFIAIMEQSMYAAEIGEPEEHDERQVAECGNCRRNFTNRERYRQHLHAHTFVKILAEDQPIICSICGNEFRKVSLYLNIVMITKNVLSLHIFHTLTQILLVPVICQYFDLDMKRQIFK